MSLRFGRVTIRLAAISKLESQIHKAVFPGTFDPCTNGHADVAIRAAKLFDEVVVAVYETPPKTLLFDTSERIELFKEAVAGVDNITVLPFSGMAVKFAESIGSSVLVRGLRIGLDFEHEREMALVWRKLAPEVEVVMLTSSLVNQYVSSTRVKEIASLDADVSSFVPAHVEKALLERLGKSG